MPNPIRRTLPNDAVIEAVSERVTSDSRQAGEPIDIKNLNEPPLDPKVEARILAEVEARLKLEREAEREKMVTATISLKESDLWKLKEIAIANKKKGHGPKTVTALLLQSAKACGHL